MYGRLADPKPLKIGQGPEPQDQPNDGEVGFTLIELLIVIVVLGILAAVTVFALSGVTSKSAVGSCNSDASAVNTATLAYMAQNPGAAPATVLALTTPAGGGPYLQTAPGSTHYIISLSVSAPLGVVLVQAPATVPLASAVAWTPGSSAACANAK